jgi:hypothetical protein
VELFLAGAAPKASAKKLRTQSKEKK